MFLSIRGGITSYRYCCVAYLLNKYLWIGVEDKMSHLCPYEHILWMRSMGFASYKQKPSALGALRFIWYIGYE